MSYYDTIDEDLKRAREILEKGKPDISLFKEFNQSDTAGIKTAMGGTIYGADTHAAYKLLESFVQEIERLRADASFTVTTGEVRDAENGGPLESTDLHLEGRGVSLLINVKAGAQFTYALRVDDELVQHGTVG